MFEQASHLGVGLKKGLKEAYHAAKAVVKSQPELNPIGGSSSPQPKSEIPLASVIEENLQKYESRDWRTYFASQLSGKGIEIGPLHRPMVRHDGMDIDYVDRCTVKELREHYPELNSLPLVEPHILDNAENLLSVPNAKYDFLIAAHVIEHMKNPLSSLEHWCRVVKPDGLIYMIVPDKRATFDVKRVRTTLSHMILDYQQPSAERDFEHYLDYAIHVHGKEAEQGIAEAQRLITTDYSIHFHVFLPTDVLNLLRWFSDHINPLQIIEGPVMSPGSDEFHFLLKVKKKINS